MRESMARLTPHFSADRTVREYTEQHYLPAAAAYRERAENKGAAGRQVVDWQRALEQKWGRCVSESCVSRLNADHHVFEVDVILNDLDPNTVRVELYADGSNGGDSVREQMQCVRPLPDPSPRCVYQATVPTTRPAKDYTAASDTSTLRVAVPLESARILWRR